MELRKYQPDDYDSIIELFYDTVHTVNAADYTEAQREHFPNLSIESTE